MIKENIILCLKPKETNTISICNNYYYANGAIIVDTARDWNELSKVNVARHNDKQWVQFLSDKIWFIDISRRMYKNNHEMCRGWVIINGNSLLRSNKTLSFWDKFNSHQPLTNTFYSRWLKPLFYLFFW